MNSQIRPACADDLAVLVDELAGYAALIQVAAHHLREDVHAPVPGTEAVHPSLDL